MVSLYRAWAAWRGVGIPGAPDALIQVGGVRFTAHARLLAAHSGYFKSVLARPFYDEMRPYEDNTKVGERYETEYERERRELESRYMEGRSETQPGAEGNVVYVPNITAQQFWPLLAYMYTGYLELTSENIYQVLLATHLLHMPRALEICRNFLSQGSSTSSATNQPLPTTVVKPIPSRKLPAFLAAPLPYRPIPYPEPPIQYIGKPYETPFKPVESTACDSRASVPETIVNATNSCEGEFCGEEKADESSLNTLHRDDIQQTDLSNNDHTGQKVLNCDKIDTLYAVNLTKSKRNSKSLNKKLKFNTNKEESPESSENVVIVKEKPDFRITPSGEEKVVVDVACCDGPVRFHRVLNKAYKSVETDPTANEEESSDTDDSYVEVEEDSRSNSETPYDNCNAFSKSLQKQMSENIRNMANKQNENLPGYDGQGMKIDGSDDASNSLLSNKSQDTIYTCVYCNHTFKSQYCYQKHARRHINPVSIDAVNQGTVEYTPDECCKSKKIGIKINPATTAGPRREVRLLDMNVQYYPCKTCGSKFPSYYFVHKHRKMCHAEELEGSVELSGKSSSDTTGPPAEKKRKLPEILTNEEKSHNDQSHQQPDQPS